MEDFAGLFADFEPVEQKEKRKKGKSAASDQGTNPVAKVI